MENIKENFPELTAEQITLFEQLQPVYEYWNERINVISRKDMDHFYSHHVLHSLAIAKVVRFVPGTEVLDVGTGGGFPGVPLAILFPKVHFHLVDARRKKIQVVEEVVNALGLKNVTYAHARAEEEKKQYDFIVSRAVTDMPTFMKWVQGKLLKMNKNGLPNGILYLKGGELKEEMKPLKHMSIEYFDIDAYFKNDAFFETKKVVYVQG